MSGVYSSRQEFEVRSEIGTEIKQIEETLARRDGHEPEFLQAVQEILQSLRPVFEKDPKYLTVFKALMEPERVIQFRVNWVDEQGKFQTNRGWRVQYNSAIGPCKGGLRLHPSVRLSILKFLGFEQIFKNSLTGLAMGGGKGGSDFDPKGKTDIEVRSFCQSFMTELSRHIGPDTDVPAGDIGVGGREIGFLFGQYRRLKNEFTGVLTGKGENWGGSFTRPEATGYGAVYFAELILKEKGHHMKDSRCIVSGSGNAAQYTCEKLLQLGAKVMTVSDSNGTIFYKNGMNKAQWGKLMHLKNTLRGRVSALAEADDSIEFYEGVQPFGCNAVSQVDLAFPSATQNEIDEPTAQGLVSKKCKLVVEVANMPCTAEAITILKKNGVLFAPAKAANAGGVAVSGLEMSQNSSRIQWSFEEVDSKLKTIMGSIYQSCTSASKKYGLEYDLQAGANIAGFLKVADSMIDQGLF